MATVVLQLLCAVAGRDARKLPQFLNHNAQILAYSWSANLPDKAAAAASVAGRGYSTLVREVEGFERTWRFLDLGLRRGFSVKKHGGGEG
jgi:hypothetical protein